MKIAGCVSSINRKLTHAQDSHHLRLAFTSISHAAFAGQSDYLNDLSNLDRNMIKQAQELSDGIKNKNHLTSPITTTPTPGTTGPATKTPTYIAGDAVGAATAQEQNRLDMLKAASTPRGSLGR